MRRFTANPLALEVRNIAVPFAWLGEWPDQIVDELQRPVAESALKGIHALGRAALASAGRDALDELTSQPLISLPTEPVSAYKKSMPPALHVICNWAKARNPLERRTQSIVLAAELSAASVLASLLQLIL